MITKFLLYQKRKAPKVSWTFKASGMVKQAYPSLVVITDLKCKVLLINNALPGGFSALSHTCATNLLF